MRLYPGADSGGAENGECKDEALTDPNGDFISKGTLLAEIEDAMHWGTCHGLADVLEIIKYAPAVGKPPEKEMDWKTAARYLKGKCESKGFCAFCEMEKWCKANSIMHRIVCPSNWIIPEQD